MLEERIPGPRIAITPLLADNLCVPTEIAEDYIWFITKGFFQKLVCFFPFPTACVRSVLVTVLSSAMVLRSTWSILSCFITTGLAGGEETLTCGSCKGSATELTRLMWSITCYWRAARADWSTELFLSIFSFPGDNNSLSGLPRLPQERWSSTVSCTLQRLSINGQHFISFLDGSFLRC